MYIAQVYTETYILGSAMSVLVLAPLELTSTSVVVTGSNSVYQ
jgi:DMSO/TMAO reductase YedYZ heme-binding membrane subunit